VSTYALRAFTELVGVIERLLFFAVRLLREEALRRIKRGSLVATKRVNAVLKIALVLEVMAGLYFVIPFAYKRVLGVR
jgi:hypothetical protein